MANSLALVFQGLSAGAAVINGIKSALDIRKLTREEILTLEESADALASFDAAKAAAAATELSGLDAEDEDLVEEKLKKLKKRWHDVVANSDDPIEWARATEERRADQCALLRTIKQLNSGKLPDQWYGLWVDLQCA